MAIKNHDFLGQYYYSGIEGTCWAEYVGPIVAVHKINKINVASGLDLEIDSAVYGTLRFVFRPEMGDVVSRHKTPRTVSPV